jgi:PPM family protein phosphatase
MTIAFGQHREKGPVREENQDQINNFQSSVFGHLFLVADGMGGHEDGAVASNMAITGFKQHFQILSKTLALREALAEAARLTNLDIYEKSEGTNALRMGSTLVACVISNNSYTVAHIGDSRCYSFRKGKLEQLTRDHTAVQKLIDLGTISPAEAINHPDASVLTRALGQRPLIELEISPERAISDNEVLLLCSDGLHGYVDEAHIADALHRNPDPQAAADALLHLALEAGGHDNISLYVIRVDSGAARAATAPDPPVATEAAHNPEPVRTPAAAARTRTSMKESAGGQRKLALSLLIVALAIAAVPVTIYLRPDLVPQRLRQELSSRFGVRLPDESTTAVEPEPVVDSTAPNAPPQAQFTEPDSPKGLPVKDTPVKNEAAAVAEPPVKPSAKALPSVIVTYPPSENPGFLDGVNAMVGRLRTANYAVTKSVKPVRKGGVWQAVSRTPESFAPPRLYISAVFLAGYKDDAGKVCAVAGCTEPVPSQLPAADLEMFQSNFKGRTIFIFVHPPPAATAVNASTALNPSEAKPPSQ